MHTVFLLIGGNAGDRLGFLEQTRAHVARSIGSVVQTSSVFESEPWGFTDSTRFLNQVIKVVSPHDPLEILTQAQAIEGNLGRIRSMDGYASRTVDVDILFIDDSVINLPSLTVPHQRLHLRRFVLEPLCEIAPDLIHPTLGASIDELLAACPDEHKVWRWHSRDVG